mgnify:CR=1 FL=1
MKSNIEELIHNKALIDTKEPVIVALSGGIDSMVLFHVIYKINKNIIIINKLHMNYTINKITNKRLCAVF